MTPRLLVVLTVLLPMFAEVMAVLDRGRQALDQLQREWGL